MRDIETSGLFLRGKLYHRIVYRVQGRHVGHDTCKSVPGTGLYRNWKEAYRVKDALERLHCYRYYQSTPDLKALYDDGYRLGVELRENTPQDSTHYDIYTSDWLLDCEINTRYMQLSLPSVDHYRARRQGIWDGFKSRQYSVEEKEQP